MANNEQLNSAGDQDTAIGLTEQRLQSMLEAAAKSAAAQAVAALTSRGDGTASLAGSAAASESTLALSLPSYKRFSLRSGCTLERAQAGSNTCMLPAMAQPAVGDNFRGRRAYVR